MQNNTQKKEKVAIIGGGAAGLIAAWQLNKKYDITLYEAERNLGGHAYSGHYLTSNNQVLQIDMGVELFTEKLCPNFFEILKLLEISTYVAPLSFSANFNHEEDYWDNVHQSSQLWLKLREECNKFHLNMYSCLNEPPSDIEDLTIGDHLAANNYSKDFIYKALLPIFTTFVGSRASLLDYSLSYCASSFNLGMLSFFQAPYWRKVKGGISRYISALSNTFLEKIKVGMKAERVKKGEKKVTIIDELGTSTDYDHLVFATHADVTLKLLESPSMLEQELLGNFSYGYVESVLHSDASVLSSKPRMYCEYNCFDKDPYNILPGSLTRNMNKLSEYSNITDAVLLTIDPQKDIPGKLVNCQKKWKLPKLRPCDMKTKRKLKKIQGKDNIWYCGMDTTLTGHEGAVTSGLVVASALGVPYPFMDKKAAYAQYSFIKDIMGI